MGEVAEECRKMGMVNSDFVVLYVTSFAGASKFYIVMELLDGVEFRDVIVARKEQPMSEAVIEHWLAQPSPGPDELVFLDAVLDALRGAGGAAGSG